MEVADWLRALGLERYEATFRENDVTAELLPSLTTDDLKDLGIPRSAIVASYWTRSRSCASRRRRLEIQLKIRPVHRLP
jgi:SAM domain (Sterile alpha motif)